MNDIDVWCKLIGEPILKKPESKLDLESYWQIFYEYIHILTIFQENKFAIPKK